MRYKTYKYKVLHVIAEWYQDKITTAEYIRLLDALDFKFHGKLER
jgi:hypothetical protein